MSHENPYVSPVSDPPAKRPPLLWLNLAATGLLLSSIFALLMAIRSAVINISLFSSSEATAFRRDHAQFVNFMWLYFSVLIGLAAFQALGALLMLMRRQRVLAMIACATAFAPSGYYITIPFGIWSLILLFRKDVSRSFTPFRNELLTSSEPD